MTSIAMRTLFLLALVFCTASIATAQIQPTSNVPIWPGLAPSETTDGTGSALPPLNKKSKSSITRIGNIRKPTLDVFLADHSNGVKPNGAGVLILPGGGFNFVVPDLEGSAAAAIFNRLGISAFVLRYRTKRDNNDSGWKNALQDAQRAMKYLRSNAQKWNLDKDKIGLLGFSSGGQTGARLLTDHGELAYEPMDAIDKIAHRPDFSMLIYPWRMYVAETDSLLPEIKGSTTLPPTFIVHTHDDNSSSLGSALFYVELKKAGVDAELHIYENGGHGYGTSSKRNSNIGTWPDRMIDWLKVRRLVTKE